MEFVVANDFELLVEWQRENRDTLTNNDYDDLLLLACANGHHKVLRQIYFWYDNIQSSELYKQCMILACSKGYLDIICQLFAMNMELKKDKTLVAQLYHIAKKHDHKTITNYLAKIYKQEEYRYFTL
jgi:hypothetical protein